MGESSYRGWERSLARLLRGTPGIKRMAKRLYKRISHLRHRRKHKNRSLVPVRPVIAEAGTSFFGYYDRSPENEAGLILVNRPAYPGVDPDLRISVHRMDGAEVACAQTNVFNWQQGSRALWLDRESFIFNRWNTTQHMIVAVVASLDGTEIELPHAVQDTFKKQYYLGINVERLSALQPEYGYASISPMSAERLHGGSEDGIWRVSIGSGASTLLYSLDHARELDVSWSSRFLDLFNHVVISPTGKRFVVLHRWYDKGVRRERLLLGLSDGSSLVSLVDTGMISHCAWADERTIIGYMRGNDNVERYWLVDVESGHMRPVADASFDGFGDGHPAVHGDWFVTDTYPDRSSHQTLLLANWKTGAWKKLGDFFHPLGLEGATRCDLHPRWSPEGTRVYFDSAFSGQRELYVMELDERCFPSS